MNQAVPHHGKLLHPHHLFTLFKWLIYILLAWNGFQFLQQDLAASAETFGDTINWQNIVEAYSAFFDTSAWLVLLLVFEFETAIIPDEFVYAFYGYLSKYVVITDLAAFNIADVCSLAGTDWNYVVDLDDYPPVDAVTCTALQGQQLLQISGMEIIGTREAFDSAWGLAVIDIVNAGTWLIIVVLLEVEVWMQLRDGLTDRLLSLSKYLKGFFYFVLFVAAAYWGFEGSFLDFWDAFLWLVAFIFIELNIFQWHEEVEEEK